MSWTRVKDEYRVFEDAAERDTLANPAKFELDIWEKRSGLPGWTYLPSVTDPQVVATPCELRIVFAPLDLPKKSTRNEFVSLFRALAIPPAFTVERVQSVSHSFGTERDATGSCAWFHFLCKHADPSAVHRRARTTLGAMRSMARDAQPLPQADYSYLRSGFFLRTTRAGNTTLVCFGATPCVRRRIEQFVSVKAWDEVSTQPYILFDLVLEGLSLEVDENVWNIGKVFGFMEHHTLSIANTSRDLITKEIFVELHNLAKHAIHLGEAIESSLLTVDGLLARVKVADSGPSSISRTGSSNSGITLTQNEVHQQLRDRLEYRKSLFQSTKLRLGSLQKRVQNSIELSFNLLTQQDSLVMIQDSNSMKVIAAITMFFLPTTAVASVLGSQLFMTSNSTGSWEVTATPLFKVMWYVAAPTTMVVAILAFFWHKYSHHHRPSPQQPLKLLVRRLTTYRQSSSKV